MCMDVINKKTHDSQTVCSYHSIAWHHSKIIGKTQPVVITRNNYMQHITGRMHYRNMHPVEDSW